MLFIIIVPSAAFADDPLLAQPHWSLELKGGRFIPDIENWRDYYGDRKTGHYAGTLAYKLFRQLEVGLEGGSIKDKGQGYAPMHDEFTGNVKYEVYPLHAFVLFRGIFGEGQWLVPYVGGGWTRMHYKEKIEYQPTARGRTDGSHVRAGLQFLLDNLDPGAANSFYLDIGVYHTYFFVEAQRIRAMINNADSLPVSVNLGGTSYLAGLLFEF